jgi:hypothetical protein
MYTPKDFDPQKMHCMKYLWVFHRRVELMKDLLQADGDFTIGEILNDVGSNYVQKILDAMSYSKQILQFETGLSDVDLQNTLKIGAVIAEFMMTTSLPEEDRDNYFGMIDNPVEMSEVDLIKLRTLRERIEGMYNSPFVDTAEFDDIIFNNFIKNNGENDDIGEWQ